MKVVVINGYPRSGKDTFVDIAETKYNVIRHSTVDNVKEFATLMGWNGRKDSDSRQMLSNQKEFYIEHFDGVFNDVVDIIIKSDLDNKEFVFIFSREPEEIQRIKDYCNNVIPFSAILIERNVSEKDHTSHSDMNVEQFNYDYTISNNASIGAFSVTIDKILPLL